MRDAPQRFAFMARRRRGPPADGAWADVPAAPARAPQGKWAWGPPVRMGPAPWVRVAQPTRKPRPPYHVCPVDGCPGWSYVHTGRSCCYECGHSFGADDGTAAAAHPCGPANGVDPAILAGLGDQGQKYLQSFIDTGILRLTVPEKPKAPFPKAQADLAAATNALGKALRQSNHQKTLLVQARERVAGLEKKVLECDEVVHKLTGEHADRKATFDTLWAAENSGGTQGHVHTGTGGRSGPAVTGVAPQVMQLQAQVDKLGELVKILLGGAGPAAAAAAAAATLASEPALAAAALAALAPPQGPVCMAGWAASCAAPPAAAAAEAAPLLGQAPPGSERMRLQAALQKGALQKGGQKPPKLRKATSDGGRAANPKTRRGGDDEDSIHSSSVSRSRSGGSEGSVRQRAKEERRKSRAEAASASAASVAPGANQAAPRDEVLEEGASELADFASVAGTTTGLQETPQETHANAERMAKAVAASAVAHKLPLRTPASG